MAKNERNAYRQRTRQSRKAALTNEVAFEWLTFKSPGLKPSTLSRYRSALDNHVLPYFENRPMTKITTAKISEFAKDRLENGRLDGQGGLAASTVRGILTILKSVLDFALKTNKIYHPICVSYPKYRSRQARVLSREEQARLEEHCMSDASAHNLGKMLCMYTGIRIGELCALRWEDISFEKGTITIKSTMQRVKDNSGGGSKTTIMIGTPKSQSSVREIPVPEFLITILKEHAKGRQGFFLSTKNSPFVEPRTMQNHFARVTKLLGMPDVNFHALRHTYATRCIEAGVDIKTLSEMLGHSSVSITLERYVHPSFDLKRESVNKLERYLRPGQWRAVPSHRDKKICDKA